MRIFVTGASGFIGRRIVRALADRGHDVLAFARDPSRVEAHERVTAAPLDLLVLESILPAIKGCDAGIHAAGVGPHATEQEMQRTNVQASRQLAGAMRQARVNRLVALSSASVLELGDTPYRRAKLGQEAAIRAYGLELTILRPTLVAGPWRESRELSALVARLARGKPFLIPGGGTRRIQPVHVGDVAQAAAAAVERPASIGKYVVIAGAEEGVRYCDFVAAARDRTGGRAPLAGLPLMPMRAAALGAAVVGLAAPIRAQIRFYGQDHLYRLGEARDLLGFAPRSYEDLYADTFGPATR